MPTQHLIPDPRQMLALLEEEGLLIIHPKQVISKRAFSILLSCSENTIDNRGNRDHNGFDEGFPEKRKTGENSVGWYASEAFDYLDSLPKAQSQKNDSRSVNSTCGGKSSNPVKRGV